MQRGNMVHQEYRMMKRGAMQRGNMVHQDSGVQDDEHLCS